jgi:hypothetical protein
MFYALLIPTMIGLAFVVRLLAQDMRASDPCHAHGRKISRCRKRSTLDLTGYAAGRSYYHGSNR